MSGFQSPTREEKTNYRNLFRSSPGSASRSEVRRTLRQAQAYMDNDGAYIDLQGVGLENIPSYVLRKTGIKFYKSLLPLGVLEAVLGFNKHIIETNYQRKT